MSGTVILGRLVSVTALNVGSALVAGRAGISPTAPANEVEAEGVVVVVGVELEVVTDKFGKERGGSSCTFP